MNSKILIEQFLKEQKEKEARKAQEKQQALERRVSDSAVRKPMTAKEVQRYASSFGFLVESGKGRHGVHLVSPDGRECPLPVHGGSRTLANGTQKSIVNFINQNGVIRS